MKNRQSSPNQNLTGTTVQQQNDTNNRKLIVIVFVSVLLTAVAMGSIVYFWQKSASNQAIDSLEEKITSLEEQGSVMEKTTAATLPSVTPPPVLSLTPIADTTAGWKTYTSPDKKYTFKYPNDWTLQDNSKYVDLYEDGNIQLSHKVSISKDRHVFKSTNPLAWGPSECRYPDIPAVDERPSRIINDFVEVKSTTAVYRRPNVPFHSSYTGMNTWTVCSFESGTDRFSTVAGFGRLYYEGPLNYNQDLIKTMDQILSTFNSIE